MARRLGTPDCYSVEAAVSLGLSCMRDFEGWHTTANGGHRTSQSWKACSWRWVTDISEQWLATWDSVSWQPLLLAPDPVV
ncbi:hypothetical protein PHLCEN_2v10765 [Hermanssonia centrifuga]|uniref:Uncharacterized protein n=1 Tax=Hermanssonia centrifuga TaxID=98765 RepID=A0A2R6NM65_9APHY|nr:hypothetical protein PHLCEN_2v10765 [Hermanssonia centrifuga]